MLADGESGASGVPTAKSRARSARRPQWSSSRASARSRRGVRCAAPAAKGAPPAAPPAALASLLATVHEHPPFSAPAVKSASAAALAAASVAAAHGDGGATSTAERGAARALDDDDDNGGVSDDDDGCGEDLMFDVAAINRTTALFDLPLTLNLDDTLCTMQLSTDFVKLPGKYGTHKWQKNAELFAHLFPGEEQPDDCDLHDALVDAQFTHHSFVEGRKLKWW